MLPKKLHFLFKDKESMILTGFIFKIGKLYGKKIIGVSIYNNVVGWGKGTFINVYFEESAYREAIRLGKKLLNKNYAEKMFRESDLIRQRFDQLVTKTKKLNLKALSNNKLAQTLKGVEDIVIEGIAYYSQSQEEPLVAAREKLKSILLSNFSSQLAQKYLELLLIPSDFDRAQQQEIDWVYLVNTEDKFTRKMFEAIRWNYSFMFRNSYNLEKSFKYFSDKFSQDKKKIKELLEEIEELKTQKKRIIKQQKNILTKINSPEAEYLAWLFQKSAIERMKLKYVWAGIEEVLFHELFLEVARRLKISWVRMVSYYRFDELIRVLRRGEDLDRKEIINRKKAVLLGFTEDKPFFYSGQKAIEMAKKNYSELFKEAGNKEIKGTVASRGKAQGKVVIIFSEDLERLAEIDKNFRVGDILVTGMTQPNMVPLMRKAGAIVTDEGGLTSHAAVISRELRKPCIVGTHVATNILKNGDIVEVDANNGLVKILKRL